MKQNIEDLLAKIKACMYIRKWFQSLEYFQPNMLTDEIRLEDTSYTVCGLWVK